MLNRKSLPMSLSRLCLLGGARGGRDRLYSFFCVSSLTLPASYSPCCFDWLRFTLSSFDLLAVSVQFPGRASCASTSLSSTCPCQCVRHDFGNRSRSSILVANQVLEAESVPQSHVGVQLVIMVRICPASVVPTEACSSVCVASDSVARCSL